MIWTLYSLAAGGVAVAAYLELSPATWGVPPWFVAIASLLLGLTWPVWLVVMAWERFRRA